MKLFTVRLTDEERARLEEHRKALGLRSESDVVRQWIARDPPRHIEPRTSDQLAAGILNNGFTNAYITFGPQTPKPGSRLKR